MPLNLVTDAWFPVLTVDGERRTIRPDQIAEDGVAWPDWPRADFNLAAYELLIGLVHLADPPRNVREWSKRRRPDPERLRERMAPLAPAFELDGNGPRFLQGPRGAGGQAERRGHAVHRRRRRQHREEERGPDGASRSL